MRRSPVQSWIRAFTLAPLKSAQERSVYRFRVFRYLREGNTANQYDRAIGLVLVQNWSRIGPTFSVNSAKGFTVNINTTCYKGSYKLRFSVGGARFSLGCSSASTATVATVKALIETDVARDEFDPTLDRYRERLTGKKSKPIEAIKVKTLIELWDGWVDSLQLPEHTKDNHYALTRSMLAKNVKTSIADINWFSDSKKELSGFTWNSRRSQLNKCWNWGIDNKLITGVNPFASLKAHKGKSSNSEIKPFSKDEIALILEAMQNNQFSNPASRFTHSHYVPFTKFLFATGVRTGEAVGLRWEHVDLIQGKVTICESLSKRNGTRVKTDTKTHTSRELPLSAALIECLSELKPIDVKPDELVFKGPKGRGYLNPDNFRSRVWIPILEGLGIEYRYPYQARHTLLSHIAKTGDLPLAAKVAGHRDLSMVTRNYGKFVGEMKLPDLIG